jgi:hypothetical protein
MPVWFAVSLLWDTLTVCASAGAGASPARLTLVSGGLMKIGERI